MLLDLHGKTSISESVDLPIADVLDKTRRAGFDGIAFCETLSSSYCRYAIEEGDKYELEVFVGVEIPTQRGRLLGFVPEIGDFYLHEQWRRSLSEQTPEASEVIDAFRERGGAVIAAKPFEQDTPYRMGDYLFSMENLTAVEAFNPRVSELGNNLALEAAQAMKLPTTGGSDPGDSDDLAHCATLFTERLESQADLVKALKKGAYWAVDVDQLDDDE